MDAKLKAELESIVNWVEETDGYIWLGFYDKKQFRAVTELIRKYPSMKLGAVTECQNFDWCYWEAPCWEVDAKKKEETK
jgi:hypothetical protein